MFRRVPTTSRTEGHDDAVWRCLLALLGEKDDADPEVAAASRLALLRLGLAVRYAHRARCLRAAWADQCRSAHRKTSFSCRAPGRS